MPCAWRQPSTGCVLAATLARHVLHISDCHLVATGERLLGVDTQRSLEAVLSQALQTYMADAVIASGDLAHAPQVAIYQRFLATVRTHTPAPLLCLPGNHDVLAHMQAASLPMAPVAVGDWTLVPLDSHVDDEPAARVDEADLKWTAAALADSTTAHCLLAAHHPWIAVNCPWLDKDRIQSPEELLEFLAVGSVRDRKPRLRGVVFGHAHQAVDGLCAGLPVFGAPATCFQFAPNSETFGLADAPPGYRWLILEDDGGVRSEVHQVMAAVDG